MRANIRILVISCLYWEYFQKLCRKPSNIYVCANIGNLLLRGTWEYMDMSNIGNIVVFVIMGSILEVHAIIIGYFLPLLEHFGVP